MTFLDRAILPITTKYNFKRECRSTEVGAQMVLRFPNNRGVSIVQQIPMLTRHNQSFELAPIVFHGPGMENFSIQFNFFTWACDGIQVFSNEEEIYPLLRTIAEMPYTLAFKTRLLYSFPCNQLVRAYTAFRNRINHEN